jgi:hypothetical protein
MDMIEGWAAGAHAVSQLSEGPLPFGEPPIARVVPQRAPTESRSSEPCASPAVPPPVRRVFPPEDWDNTLPHVLAEITATINPKRRHRSCPRTVKRARHNNYHVKKPDERASTRHHGPPTIHIHALTPQAA